MKPLSKYIQETFKNESLKELFVEKLVEEELDALNRVAPVEKVTKADTGSLIDIVVGVK